MVFSSIIFLLFFLPVVVTGHLLLILPAKAGGRRRIWVRAANIFVLISSLVFYFWGEQFLVWIVIASTLIDYFCGLLISGGLFGGSISRLEPGGTRTSRQKATLILSVCSNLAFLGIFKYFNFGLDSYNAMVTAFGIQSAGFEGVARITLPLGISFYTFQSMSYTIDVYRGHVRATGNLVDFACYVTMFPQLVAGPIVRYRDVAARLVNRRVTVGVFASGVGRFIMGLGKKVLIADLAAIPAEKIMAMDASGLSTGAAWLGAAAYALQIYFDFSGYSDMAIGLGRMLGFEFPENFNYPYVARSIRQFWRRWHISLSTWFRDYLYIPLGGSRLSSGRTYFNLVAVFFLCGLWHGASLNFIVWGLFHGTFLVLEKLWLEKRLSRLGAAAGHVYTMAVLLCGWVIFARENLSEAAGHLAAMAGFGTGSPGESLSSYLPTDVRFAIVAGAVLATGAAQHLARTGRRFMARLEGFEARVAAAGAAVVKLAGLLTIVLICLMLLSAGTHSPFIYFRF